MKKIINIIILVLFFVLTSTFALKNGQLVNVNYYAGLSTQTELFKIVFAALGVGLLFGYFISISARLRTRSEMKKAQQQAKIAEDNLVKVKNNQNLVSQ